MTPRRLTRRARRGIAAALLAVSLTGVLASCDSTVDSPRVLVIGDSILNQSTDEVRGALAQAGWDPFVLGYSGSAIEQWTAHLPQLLADHDPSIVVVELGTNDCTDGVCPDLDVKIERALAALEGAEQILWLNVQTGPTYPAGAERINRALEDAAGTRANLRIVDFSDRFADHPAWLDAGGPHLTPAGQLAFAKLITDAVDEFDVAPE